MTNTRSEQEQVQRNCGENTVRDRCRILFVRQLLGPDIDLANVLLLLGREVVLEVEASAHLFRGFALKTLGLCQFS